MRLKYGAVALAVLAAQVLANPLYAHETRPGYLELKEVAPGRYEVLFKRPGSDGPRLRITADLPANCQTLTAVSTYHTSQATLERWTVECEGGIIGGTIGIGGLEAELTEVLVQIRSLDAFAYTVRLRPDAPSFVVPEAPSAWETARTYLVLGVEHILLGFDHLLFVFALMLIVKGMWLLVKTITAFTVAHTITLGAATLGFVHVPGAPVEAVIALSIMFLASELAHSRLGRPGMTQSYPWIVASTFGLLHGFGFAGALAEVGLPQGQIPTALFLFNVGVEVGQLLFVGVVLLAAYTARRLRLRWPVWSWRLPAYAIGSIAAFWTVQRVVAFW